MPPVNRREFLATATSGAALALLARNASSTPSTTESLMSQAIAPALASSAELIPLPFDPAKLDGLSEKLIRSHWENNYGGSVKAMNAVKLRLATALGDADLPPFIYNGLKREYLMRTGSVVLHELY